jgi:hypothetical protein
MKCKLGLFSFVFFLIFYLGSCKKGDIVNTPSRDFRDSITGFYNYTGNCIDSFWTDAGNPPGFSWNLNIASHTLSGTLFIEKSNNLDSNVIFKAIKSDSLSTYGLGIIFTSDSVYAKGVSHFYEQMASGIPGIISIEAKYFNDQVIIPQQGLWQMSNLIYLTIIGGNITPVRNKAFKLKYIVHAASGGKIVTFNYDLSCYKQ